MWKDAEKRRKTVLRAGRAYRERNREKERLRSLKYYHTHKPTKVRDPVKEEARKTVCLAVKEGRIIKPRICSRCGKERKLQAHHVDYAKPLDIVWVCSWCHGAIHQIETTRKAAALAQGGARDEGKGEVKQWTL
jgi:ribosomal protein S27AE